MKKSIFVIVGIALIAALNSVSSCKKDGGGNNTVDTTLHLTPDTIYSPPHFPKPIIPADNQPFKEREALGRKLFYDSMVLNGTNSCGGCHDPSAGFSNLNMKEGKPVLPHSNLAWYSNFLWDGSQKGTLEDLALFEISVDHNVDLSLFNNNATYKQLFKTAFGVDNITYKEMSYALAQFMRTLVSKNTRYEEVKMRGNGTFTADEQAGYNIFFTEKGDCFHCHINPIFTDDQLHNTGLDTFYTLRVDRGYFNISGDSTDMGKFRTPNLRNVATRKFFMHDGRFTTLEQVVDFYDHGMHKVSNLDPIMALPYKANGLHLTTDEKRQLIAFLNTLTDSTFLNNPAYGRP